MEGEIMNKLFSFQVFVQLFFVDEALEAQLEDLVL